MTQSTEYPIGWTCTLVALRFERYLLATLPRVETLAVAEHVEACASCAHVLVLRRTQILPPPKQHRV